MRSYLFISLLSLACLSAEPPRKVPKELYQRFTMGERIPVIDYYWDNTVSDDHYFYSKQVVDQNISKVKQKKSSYYGITDQWLYKIMDRRPNFWKGKTIAIMGSVKPWYEAIVLAYGAKPYTIEYNNIGTDDSRLTIVKVEDFKKNPRKFDVVLSISSFEHDGLGRYGDPLDPDGDLRAMKEALDMLNPNGYLLLALPVGPDCLTWNAHRVYGPRRLRRLLDGWQMVESEGFNPEKLFRAPVSHWGSTQPVFLLKPRHQT